MKAKKSVTKKEDNFDRLEKAMRAGFEKSEDKFYKKLEKYFTSFKNYVEKRFDNSDAEIKELRKDVSGLKEDLSEVKSTASELVTEIEIIKNKLVRIEEAIGTEKVAKTQLELLTVNMHIKKLLVENIKTNDKTSENSLQIAQLQQRVAVLMNRVGVVV